MASPVRAPARIFLAMATFNGGSFLAEQLSSLRQQTVADWTLLVRDDGSSDDTLDVLRRAASRDTRIEIVTDHRGTLGAIGNFGHLAVLALNRGADRLFFVDQDDMWFPDKLARTCAAIDGAELTHGVDTPVLAHTDLQLVDAKGATIARSFMQFQRVRHEDVDPLRTLLVQNFVTGCATAVNRSLLALSTPVPAVVPMHDWWFALCAAAAGIVVYVPSATLAYRRHDGNAVAVRGFWRTLNPLRTNWATVWQSGRHTHERTLRQAAALQARLQERQAGSTMNRELVAHFIAAQKLSPLARINRMRVLGIRSQTLPRTAALYARTYCSSQPASEA